MLLNYRNTTSLMTNNVEHLFICISPMENVYSDHLPIFKLGCFSYYYKSYLSWIIGSYQKSDLGVFSLIWQIVQGFCCT
jgi:hypothetical protein